MTFKSLVGFILCCCVVTFLNACVSPHPPQIFSIDGHKNPTTIKILKNDLEGKQIDRSYVLNQLSQVILNGGPELAEYGYKSISSYLNQDSRMPTFIPISESEIMLRFCSGGRQGVASGISSVDTVYPYSIKEDENFYEIILFPPNNYTMNYGRAPRGINFDYSIYTEKTVPFILSKLNAVKQLSIRRVTKVTGEINVEFNDEAIFANFERKLGSFIDRSGSKEKVAVNKSKTLKYNGNSNNSKDTIEKKNVYSLEINGTIYPVNIFIYPYRNGSKVVYDIDIPYSITDSYSLTKETISKISKKIEDVAKD